MSFAGGPSGAHNSCDIQDQDQDRELIDFSPRASLDQPQGRKPIPSLHT